MEEKPLVTQVDPQTLSPQNFSPKPPIALFLVAIFAGLVTGFFLSRQKAASSPTSSSKELIQTSTEIGSLDTATFRDHAQGTLEAGGLNGEGTHKLVREGGPSKTVYLVSSIINLDDHVGKKVEVWGETLRPKKVGWLMDVGRLKIIE